jgi:hypothetical protein
MNHEGAIAKLISARRHCFGLGVLGRSPDSDFRQAFRTLNRLYVEVRLDIALEGHSGISKPSQARPSEAKTPISSALASE